MELARALAGSSAARGRRQCGFTLVELMVTLAVLAILLGIAVPSFSQFILSGKLRSYSNEFVSSVLLARSEAIKRNQQIRLCVANLDGDACEGGSLEWEAGWIIVITETGEVLHRQPAITDGFKIIGAVSSIDFQPSGVGSTQTTLKVCRATPSVGDKESQITLRATGRTAVERVDSSSCS